MRLDFWRPRHKPVVMKVDDFRIMHAETSKKNTKVFEMYDLSQEARQEQIRAQIDGVAKKLIPTTYSTKSMNSHPVEGMTYKYYQFFLGMGYIQVNKQETPPLNCTSYFTVESENKSFNNARGHCWDTNTYIVSVKLQILVEDERENAVAMQVLQKAQSILVNKERY